jgi:hypothetical protein
MPRKSKEHALRQPDPYNKPGKYTSNRIVTTIRKTDETGEIIVETPTTPGNGKQILIGLAIVVVILLFIKQMFKEEPRNNRRPDISVPKRNTTPNQ